MEESSLAYRLFYYNLSMTFYRFRYYSAWELADASIRACGAAYNGRDEKGNAKWDRIESLNLVKIETGYNVRDLKDVRRCDCLGLEPHCSRMAEELCLPASD